MKRCMTWIKSFLILAGILSINSVGLAGVDGVHVVKGDENMKNQLNQTDGPARVVLEGVPRIGWGTGTAVGSVTTFPMSLWACMEFMGESYPVEYVFATSGAAFRLFWKPNWYADNVGIEWTEDPRESYLHALEALGYESEYISKEEDRDNASYFRRRIIESIRDKGRPVIAQGVIGPPEWCIIAGYDEYGEILMGWNYFQGGPGAELEPSGYFCKRNWFEDTHNLVIIGEKQELPPLGERYQETLQFATQIVRTPVTRDRPSGLAAYTAWAEALLRDEDFPAGDVAIARQHLQSHDENMNVVGEGRWCAWRFLRQAAEDMPAISDDLMEAAKCYEAEYMLMCQGWNLMGGLGSYSQDQGVKFADPTIRRQISSLILQARGKDEEAVRHIERALERWTAPIPKALTYEDDTPMVLIPAGEFQMGDVFSEGGTDERPIHTVYVDAFYIDTHEVTNAQYRRFVQATGHRAPEGFGYVNGEWVGFKPWLDENFNGDDQPVVCVSWVDARAYCEWAGKRLPTEAEWEKAARGGLVGRKFPWGNEAPDGTQCNFADGNADDGYQYTSSVGSFAPNGYGLYDMAGNVWEWCSDWYDPAYYSKSPRENPAGPSSGTSRVLRGGSWNLNSYYMRVSFRFPGVPEHSHGVAEHSCNFVGFRCAQGAKP